MEIVRTPYRAPNANAIAERWIRSARQECLDHVLLLGERHTWCVLREYVAFYNQRRPHQGLAPIVDVRRERTRQDDGQGKCP